MTKVYQSTVVETEISRVWAVVRDFNGLPNWHSAIAESQIEQGLPADQVGCIRNFKLRDGGQIREQLLALSDYDLYVTYSILQSPMAVENYTATLSLKPITESNHTFVDWSAEFDCPADQEAELIHSIGEGVFKGGFDSLKRFLAVR